MTAEEYAQQMMRRISNTVRQPGSVHAFLLSARWWYWNSRISKNPIESIAISKNQYRIARHMEADPGYYRRKPADVTHFNWMKRAA